MRRKARWLKEEGGPEEPDTALRQLVIGAIKHALQLDETWELEFQLLLRSDHPPEGKPDGEKKVKRDLKIFETDEEIRELIGLPRKRRKPETQTSTKVASGPPAATPVPPESAPAPPSPASEVASRP
jgi:hypothetical protein